MRRPCHIFVWEKVICHRYCMPYKTKFFPKNVSKYIGDCTNIICRSLWERRFCKYLDENRNVIRWASEEIVIPYYSPVDKKTHRYYPDFYVEMKDKSGDVKTLLVEIKPEKQTKIPTKGRKRKNTYLRECMAYEVNIAKWKYATEYCEKRGWEFKILTEKELYGT
tara:strand:- start:149 stop:643 length:495 start_codon:yes stop_codon:yes gene_type:complete